MTEDERMALAVFARAPVGSGCTWVATSLDPPDAVTSDGQVGLEITRLAPGSELAGGSPLTRRQSLRDRILFSAQEQLRGHPGRGFRVAVGWWDHDVDLRRNMVNALSADLVEIVLAVADDARKRAVSENAGDLVLYPRNLVGRALSAHAADVSLSWTPGTINWDCAGSTTSSINLTGSGALQATIDAKNSALKRWTIEPAERWLLIHLDPSTFTDDNALIAGPYRFDFDRVFVVDTVELTCREVRRATSALSATTPHAPPPPTK